MIIIGDSMSYEMTLMDLKRDLNTLRSIVHTAVGFFRNLFMDDLRELALGLDELIDEIWAKSFDRFYHKRDLGSALELATDLGRFEGEFEILLTIAKKRLPYKEDFAKLEEDVYETIGRILRNIELLLKGVPRKAERSREEEIRQLYRLLGVEE